MDVLCSAGCSPLPQCKLEETLRQCAHADIPAMPNAPQIFTHIKLGKVGSSLPGISSCFVHRCPLKRQGVLERYLAREIAALRACHTPTAVADPFHAHIVNPAYRACLSREGWEADGVPPVASPFSPSSVLRPHFWAFHEDPTDPALLVDWMLVSRGLYHEQLAWLFRFHPARQVRTKHDTLIHLNGVFCVHVGLQIAKCDGYLLKITELEKRANTESTRPAVTASDGHTYTHEQTHTGTHAYT
jgi:hypothetical protein